MHFASLIKALTPISKSKLLSKSCYTAHSQDLLFSTRTHLKVIRALLLLFILKVQNSRLNLTPACPFAMLSSPQSYMLSSIYALSFLLLRSQLALQSAPIR
uniref:Uncharacterized protein n=1 Tax=Cacopsylla melanoneura TaxID=428564 RepID=A0A8D8W5G8_9HEMI